MMNLTNALLITDAMMMIQDNDYAELKNQIMAQLTIHARQHHLSVQDIEESMAQCYQRIDNETDESMLIAISGALHDACEAAAAK